MYINDELEEKDWSRCSKWGAEDCFRKNAFYELLVLVICLHITVGNQITWTAWMVKGNGRRRNTEKVINGWRQCRCDNEKLDQTLPTIGEAYRLRWTRTNAQQSLHKLYSESWIEFLTCDGLLLILCVSFKFRAKWRSLSE